MPFAILIMVAVASLFLSIVISAEDIPVASQSVRSVRRTGPSMARHSAEHSAHSSKRAAFVHHTTAVRSQPSYLTTLRMNDELTPMVARFDRSEEVLSPPVNHLNKPEYSKHYACPPTSIESLRKRYGTRQSLWGEWSNAETRAFYRTQLPRALQIDGALGLTLEERAQLASEARHALRVYSRERCYLPGRVAARIYDGLRHFQLFGYWSCDGMNWTEVKEKYARDGRIQLGEGVSKEELEMFVYRKIVDRACATNAIFDHYASQGSIEHGQLLTLIKGIFAIENIKSARPPRIGEKDVITAELERQLEDERELANYVRTVPYQEDRSNGDVAQGSSMSMTIAYPRSSLVSSQLVSSMPKNIGSIENIGDVANEGMKIMMDIVSIAMGKGEQLRYLIESQINVSPFH